MCKRNTGFSWHIKYLMILAAIIVGFGASTVLAQGACPDPRNGEVVSGPFDYTDPRDRSENIPVIEEYHFKEDVEFLRRDNIAHLGRNIAYTLNRVPNHHRALRSMTLLVQRAESQRPEGLGRSLDCWFSRAERFRPDDGVVPMIHGMYYYDQENYEKALEKMREGLEDEPNNRNIHYNIGLVYTEMERYEEAREHARQAYERNFPLDGLRRKLQAVNEWE